MRVGSYTLVLVFIVRTLVLTLTFFFGGARYKGEVETMRTELETAIASERKRGIEVKKLAGLLEQANETLKVRNSCILALAILALSTSTTPLHFYDGIDRIDGN
jgi:hypothetical protein